MTSSSTSLRSGSPSTRSTSAAASKAAASSAALPTPTSAVPSTSTAPAAEAEGSYVQDLRLDLDQVPRLRDALQARAAASKPPPP